MTKKTYNEIGEFNKVSTLIVRYFQAKESSENKKNTPEELKVKYALQKVSKNLESSIEKFQDELFEINLDLCSLDSDGNVMYNEKGEFKYTKDNLKKQRKKIKELNKKTVEFEPHFVKIPKDFSEEMFEPLRGFIFEELIKEE